MDHFYYNFDELIFSIFDGLTPLELNFTIFIARRIFFGPVLKEVSKLLDQLPFDVRFQLDCPINHVTKLKIERTEKFSP